MKYDDVPLWHRARLTPKDLLRYRAWRRDHRQAIFSHRTGASGRSIGDDKTHLNKTLQWLLRCQDEAVDGGFVGRYRFDKGWTSSYPETTGYIIPTLLNLAEDNTREKFTISVSADELASRAIRAADFLLGIQLPNGAFPAGEIAANTEKPSPFNSAQIINGLHQLHVHHGDEKYIVSAIRAAEWLLSVQDNDGAWRQWFYHNIPATYCAHLACWIAELGSYLEREDFLQSARQSASWILDAQDQQTGFFDKCGFTEKEQRARIADLHTIAYNQAGLLRIAKALDSEEVFNAASRAGRGVLATLERLGWLPGILDFQWQSMANSSCLTGCAQMALVWLAMNEHQPDERLVSGAAAAIGIVKRGQIAGSDNPALDGAIPGSDPLWGWYNDGIFPNWAAKFFIDALLEFDRTTSQ